MSPTRMRCRQTELICSTMMITTATAHNAAAYCVYAPLRIVSITKKPMPPPATKPTTVAERMLMSQRSKVYARNGGMICGMTA